MGIVYPKFPTVDRPPDLVHTSDGIASADMVDGRRIVTYQCLDPRLIGLTFSVRERREFASIIALPANDLRTVIAVLTETLHHLEGAQQ